MMIKLFSDPFPITDLDNEFLLREIELDDALCYYDYINAKEVSRYLAKDCIPSSLQMAVDEVRYWRSLFRNRISIYWGIAKRDSNELIGTIGFNNWIPSEQRGEISYDLNCSYSRRGITTKALSIICEFAESEMQIERMQATVAIDNIASIRVLEKNNFLQEGLLKKYARLENRACDFYMYARVV